MCPSLVFARNESMSKYRRALRSVGVAVSTCGALPLMPLNYERRAHEAKTGESTF